MAMRYKVKIEEIVRVPDPNQTTIPGTDKVPNKPKKEVTEVAGFIHLNACLKSCKEIIIHQYTGNCTLYIFEKKGGSEHEIDHFRCDGKTNEEEMNEK